MSVLSRAWQILLKGIQEVKDSPRPLAAADMVLVRLAYAADLPSPEDALKQLTASAERRRPAPRGGGRRLRPVRRRHRAPRAPRAAQATASAASRAAARRAECRAEPSCWRVCRTGGAGGRQARHPDSRSRWSATCGWCVSSRVGSNSRWRPAPRRSLPAQLMRKIAGMDRPALDGGALHRRGRAEPDGAGRGREEEKRVGVQAHPLVRAALDQFPRRRDRRRARRPRRKRPRPRRSAASLKRR